jgi:hypothetical protein
VRESEKEDERVMSTYQRRRNEVFSIIKVNLEFLLIILINPIIILINPIGLEWDSLYLIA